MYTCWMHGNLWQPSNAGDPEQPMHPTKCVLVYHDVRGFFGGPQSHSLTACYHGYSGGNTNVETVPTHPIAAL